MSPHRTNQKIAWQSTSGAVNAGEVTFRPLSTTSTEVNLKVEAEPQTITEKIGDAAGMLDRKVKNDLERFKRFIESRGGEATGAWRGEVNS